MSEDFEMALQNIFGKEMKITIIMRISRYY